LLFHLFAFSLSSNKLRFASHQYFMIPLLLKTSFFSTLISALLYLIAAVYYCHITFLGYQGSLTLSHSHAVARAAF
jgi:hypothetical protein